MFAFSNRLYCLTNSRKAKAIRKDREKQQIHINDKLEIMETNKRSSKKLKMNCLIVSQLDQFTLCLCSH